METLPTITVNLSGHTRTEIVNGREFIVAPVTILIQGVLNGSMGPLFYPSNEIEKSLSQWNGRPLVNNHPVIDGVGVSANSPSVIHQYEIGRVYNTQLYQENGRAKLVSEAWFDLEMTKAVEPRILRKLKQGKPIEVSTGLFTDNIVAKKNSAFEGKQYTHIATNFRPDHLAILLDDKGACSVKDGCGVFNQEATDNKEPRKYSSTQINLPKHIANKIISLGKQIPDSDLASDGRETNPHITIKYGLHTNDSKEVQDIIKGFGTVKYKLGNLSIFNGSDDVDYDVLNIEVHSEDLVRLNQRIAKLEHTDTHKEYNCHATIAYLKKGLGEKYAKQLFTVNEEGTSDSIVFSSKDRKTTTLSLNNVLVDNPGWVKDHDAWMKAKDAAQKEGKGEDYATITEIYKRMGGTVGNESADDGQIDEKKECSCKGVSQGMTCTLCSDTSHKSNDVSNKNVHNQYSSQSNDVNNKEYNMPVSFKNRSDVIDWFVINVNKNATKMYVNEMTDEQIWESVVQNAKEQMETNDTATFMKWMSSAPSDIQNSMVQLMRSQISGKGATNQFPAKKEDDKTQQGTNPQQTPAQKSNDPSKVPQQQAPQQTPQQSPVDPEEQKKKAMMNNNEQTNNMNNNTTNNSSPKVKTLEEYLNDPTLPPQVREAVTNSINITNKAKADIINRLVANVAADKKEKAIERYSKWSLSELETELDLRGPVGNQQVNNGIIPVTQYIGNTGGPVNNNNQPTQRTPMERPTLNYEQIAKETVRN